ncbi:MAG: gluconate 2-dehydrogenase subunit 3 family protein [Saprospiraceae bacterium]
MKRRDALKSIGLTSLGLAGLHPQVQAAEFADFLLPDGEKKDPPFEQFGRTETEIARDAKLFAEQFFTKHEMKTISVLVDIIIPADEKSGSATDAGVPAFIEFMAKDQPDFQIPLRGGLKWLDLQAIKRFEREHFVKLTKAQQLEIVDDIAYPERKKPGMTQGIAFFSLMRNLTASGFWSSQMGIADIGYMGNTPNQWDGPPEDVIQQYGLEAYK